MSIFGEIGLQPNIAHRASSAEIVRTLVANGFGFSPLNFTAPGTYNRACVELAGAIRSSNLVAYASAAGDRRRCSRNARGQALLNPEYNAESPMLANSAFAFRSDMKRAVSAARDVVTGRSAIA